MTGLPVITGRPAPTNEVGRCDVADTGEFVVNGVLERSDGVVEME